MGSRVGAVVRALASHQCVPGSIPGPGVICGLSLLLVIYSAPRGFSPGTPVFPSHQKPTLLNSNSIWKQWMKSRLVEMPLQIPIIIIIIIIIKRGSRTFHHIFRHFVSGSLGSPRNARASTENWVLCLKIT